MFQINGEGHRQKLAVSWPLGGGEMGRLLRSHQWEKTSLGSIENWPSSLLAALDLVLRSPMAMMISWGAEGISFYNDAFGEIAGGHHPALLGTRIIEASHELADLGVQVLPRVLRGEAFCLRNQRLHGRSEAGSLAASFDLACSPIAEEHGSPAGLLVIATETTEKNQTKAKLYDKEALLRRGDIKYRALFDSIDVGFCIIQLKFDGFDQPVDYCFLEVNPAFIRQTGLRNPEGQWMRTLAPGHEQHWFDTYGRVAVTGIPIRFENLATALGERWYEVYAFRIGTASERQVAILFNDIKERKQSEEALRNAHRALQETSDKLRRSNEDLEEFTRVAGHDLRAPIRGVIQFSELLERTQIGQASPEAGVFLEQIVNSGKRMMRLVDDLFWYATVSQAPYGHTAPIQANLAYSQAKDQLIVALKESEATLEGCISEEVTVRIELSLLTQLFQNLIENAIHYGREGFRPFIEVTAAAQDDFWRFAVQDNGEGIDERYTSLIFEPFRRLHGPERPGSGIGLASCKRIIERANGKIWVQSQLGEGSIFYFLLPKAWGSDLSEE